MAMLITKYTAKETEIQLLDHCQSDHSSRILFSHAGRIREEKIHTQAENQQLCQVEQWACSWWS
jgi:hypothetical protein